MWVAAAAWKRLIIYPVGPLHNRPRILLLPIPSTSCTLVSSYCPLSPGLLQEPPNSSACDSPGSRTASPVLCSPQNCHSDPLNWKPVHTAVLFRTLSWLPVSLGIKTTPTKSYTLWAHDHMLLWPGLPMQSSLLTLLQPLFLQILSRLPSSGFTLACLQIPTGSALFHLSSIITLH